MRNKSLLLISIFIPLFVLSISDNVDAKIKRSSSAKREFKKERPCPSTGQSTGACPGWVIDHIKPLKKGGPDRPSNMQWQSVEEAKEKDRWE